MSTLIKWATLLVSFILFAASFKTNGVQAFVLDGISILLIAASHIIDKLEKLK